MTGSTRAAGAAAGWAAAALPLVCAAHCMATPLLVVAAPALALSEGTEAVVKAASALLAAALVWRGIRLHGRAAVALPVLAGLALWGGAAALGAEGAAERLWTAAGGVLLAAGMWWSAQLRHRAACRACGCAAHGPAAQFTTTGIAGEV